MPLPRSPEGAVEINRGCDPRSTRPLTRLFPAPRWGAGHPSRLASSPPPSPAPLRGAGERRYTLISRGFHPRLSASRPSGACPLKPMCRKKSMKTAIFESLAMDKVELRDRGKCNCKLL